MKADHDTGSRGDGAAADVSTHHSPWETWTCRLSINPGGTFTAHCPELGLSFTSVKYSTAEGQLMTELARRAAASLGTKGAANSPTTGAHSDGPLPDAVITYRQ